MNEPTIPPEAIALEEFLRDPAAAFELREFLATDTGRKFRGVLAAMHPMNTLCQVGNLKPESIRALAHVEKDIAQSQIAFLRGYGCAIALIETLGKTPSAKLPPQTRKGGRGIPPHIP